MIICWFLTGGYNAMTIKDTILQKGLNNPQNISFEKDIGKTTYVVNAHFSDKTKEDIVSKVKSLITRLH